MRSTITRNTYRNALGNQGRQIVSARGVLRALDCLFETARHVLQHAHGMLARESALTGAMCPAVVPVAAGFERSSSKQAGPQGGWKAPSALRFLVSIS
jgi:hypothetical protein